VVGAPAARHIIKIYFKELKFQVIDWIDLSDDKDQ
jgi:hypothetical protein